MSRTWDEIWTDPNSVDRWKIPDVEIENLVPLLVERKCKRALDLGCGPGRHMLVLARAGLEVHGIDESENALHECAANAAHAQQSNVTLHRADMADITTLYSPSSFDVVICWNVIYHAQVNKIQRTLDAIHSVLAPRGFLYITFNSIHNKSYGQGREVEPSTFVDASEKKDGQHLHHYSSDHEVQRFLHRFQVLHLFEADERLGRKTFPNTAHWYALAQKPVD